MGDSSSSLIKFRRQGQGLNAASTNEASLDDGMQKLSSTTSTVRTKSVGIKFLFVSIVSFVSGIIFAHPHSPQSSNRIDIDIDYGFEPPAVMGTRGVSKEIRKSDRRTIPRVIGLLVRSNQTLDIIIISASRIRRRHGVLFQDSIPSNGPRVSASWYEPSAMEFLDKHDESCVPMASWFLDTFTNCNSFHEIDLSSLKMINHGGSRIAFEINQHLPDETQTHVYKTLRYDFEVDPYHIEEQRKDALVMERTSKSSFIPDIHGYCSLAVLMDFMPEGSMHDYIKGSRIAGRIFNGDHGVEDTSGKLLKTVDRLRVGIHVATSVADLHSIDGTNTPSLFHNDLCCHQYLFQNGVFKLNDFNFAQPIYIHKNSGKVCTRKSFGMLHWKARSLEEHMSRRGMLLDPPLPDKVDVWMMGNILYYILTDLYTFERPMNLNNEKVGRLLVKGKRSPYPNYITNSPDPSRVAMKRAIEMCWTQNWRERPSARSISDFMMGELRKITGEISPDLRVVLPERDPNQSSSDEEYEEFND